MKETKVLLQDYADAYCGGDRRRALYNLLFIGKNGRMDDYIDELNTAEANFVYDCMALNARRVFGGELGFKKVIKTETMAEQLDLSTDDILNGTTKNPYKKQLQTGSLMLAGSILLVAVQALIRKHTDIDVDWLTTVISILSGISSLSVAEGLIGTIRFHRLKKRVKNTPQARKDVEPPSFEECMEFHLERSKDLKEIPPATAEEAIQVLNTARKKNLRSLAFAPLLLAIVLTVGVSIAVGNIVAGTAGKLVTGISGIGGILAFAWWQIRAMAKATMATTNVVRGLDRTDPQWQRLNNRQSLCVLGMICIAGLYLILVTVGCAIYIGLITTL